MTDSTKATAAPAKRFRIWIIVAIVVGVLALLSAFLFPLCSAIYSEANSAANRGRNIVSGRIIVSVLEKYAGEHGDALPASLQDLIPTYLTEERLAQLAFVDDHSHEHYEWLYFPHIAPEPGVESIVLASPKIGMRIVISMNAEKHLGASSVLTEKAFKQKRPDRPAAPQAPDPAPPAK